MPPDLAELASLPSNFALRDGLAAPAILPFELLRSQKAKNLAKRLRTEIQAGHHDAAQSIAAAFLGLSRGRVLVATTFSDQFRPTTYEDAVLPNLEQVLTGLVEESTRQSAMATTTARLEHWRTYVQLYVRTRRDETRLVGSMTRRRKHACVAALTLAEVAFAHPKRFRAAHPKSFDDLLPEDVLTAASYAIETFARRVGLTAGDFTPFSNATMPGAFKGMLLEAYRLRELLDLEADVYRAGYSCTVEDSGRTFRIDPPDARFGQAMDLGYVLHQMLPARMATNSPPKHWQPLAPLVDAWVRATTPALAGLTGEGRLRRFQIGLPAQVLEVVGDKFIKPDVLFAEEATEVGIVASELQMNAVKLLEFELAPTLRLMDVLKIQRVLRILTATRFDRLRKDDVTGPVFWNSIVGGMTPQAFRKTLVSFGIKESTADEWIRLFTWDATKPSFLDLQYTPAVRIPEAVAVLGAVACSSNLFRNGMIGAEHRPWSDDDGDMISAFADAFRDVPGARTETGVAYQFLDVAGELDCIVVIGAHAFVFECKRTLLPCSSFERRTTIDCLSEATDQLDRLAALWPQEEFRKYLGRKIGTDLIGCELHGCIVLSHRLLSGAEWGGWPIRKAAEVANLAATGEGSVTIGGTTVPRRLRPPGDLTTEQLLNYLSSVSTLLAPQWKSMIQTDERMRFLDCELRVPRFGLNWVRFAIAIDIVPADLLPDAEKLARLVDEDGRMGALGAARSELHEALSEKFGEALESHLKAQIQISEKIVVVGSTDSA